MNKLQILKLWLEKQSNNRGMAGMPQTIKISEVIGKIKQLSEDKKYVLTNTSGEFWLSGYFKDSSNLHTTYTCRPENAKEYSLSRAEEIKEVLANAMFPEEVVIKELESDTK